MQQHCSGDQDHRVGDEHEDAQIQPRKRPLQRPSEGGGAAHSPACAQDLARIRERQYALDIEENEYGTFCVGSAVIGPDGKVLGAVSLTGQTLTKEEEAFLAGKLLPAVSLLSKLIAYNP